MKFFEERKLKKQYYEYEDHEIENKEYYEYEKKYLLEKKIDNIYINIEINRYKKVLYTYFKNNDIIFKKYRNYVEWIISKRDIINGRHPVIIIYLENNFLSSIHWINKYKEIKINNHNNFFSFDKNFRDNIYNNVYRTKNGLDLNIF